MDGNDKAYQGTPLVGHEVEELYPGSCKDQNRYSRRALHAHESNHTSHKNTRTMRKLQGMSRKNGDLCTIGTLILKIGISFESTADLMNSFRYICQV